MTPSFKIRTNIETMVVSWRNPPPPNISKVGCVHPVFDSQVKMIHTAYSISI